MWHHRLGYVSDSHLRHISIFEYALKHGKDTCLSCSMAKFSKLPYSLSDSHALKAFDFIHIDTWGSYKVPTYDKHIYFLTIVYDFSRATWTDLMINFFYASSILKSFLKFVNTRLTAG